MGILAVLLCGCGDSDPVVEPLEVSWRRMLGSEVDSAAHPFVFDRDDNFVLALHRKDVDCFELRKLGPDGAELWRRPFTEPPPDPLHCPREASPAVDAQGNIVALDHSVFLSSPDINSDIFLRKYGPQGDIVWTRYHDGGGSGLDLGEAVATDRAGNIVIGGAEAWGMGTSAPLIAKYSPGGMLLWLQHTDPVAGHSIAVGTDGAGDVLAVRALEDASRRPIGLELHKLDPDGAPVWQVTLSTQPGVGASLAVRPDGSSVVALTSNQLLGFDADGRTAFDVEVSPRLSTVDGASVTATPQHAALAPDGTIAVTSFAVVTRCDALEEGCQDSAVLLGRYTSEGALISRGLIEGSSGVARRLTADSLAFDSRGRLAFTGVDNRDAVVAVIDAE